MQAAPKAMIQCTSDGNEVTAGAPAAAQDGRKYLFSWEIHL